MQSQLVFREKNEIKRLRVQIDLLSSYEAPILAQIFSEGRNLSILDIGCNDGKKTVERFSSESVSQVIGLEYNEELATKAQRTYGNGQFSFYRLDVEAEDFAERLCEIMKEKKIDRFDMIYLSFVLMHLSDVKRLLESVYPFLKENGKLFIIEANDSASTLSNDKNGLVAEFMEILKKDKYSGNRVLGKNICEVISDSGYNDICVWYDAISAGEGEKEKKEAIFTTFFTYLPEDILLLLDAEPGNEEYKSWSAWIDLKFKTLKRLILQEKSVISMGLKILTCKKGKE